MDKLRATHWGKIWFHKHMDKKIVAAIERGKAQRRKQSPIDAVIASPKPMDEDRDQKPVKIKEGSYLWVI